MGGVVVNGDIPFSVGVKMMSKPFLMFIGIRKRRKVKWYKVNSLKGR